MEDTTKQASIKEAITKIQAESIPFGHPSPHIKEYAEYYQLPVQTCKHEYGYMETKGFKLFVQRFCPSEPVGTVLLMHGYLDHVGSFSKVIQFLVENHYEVISYDLPGHGLSSGERATITEFEDYVTTVQVIYDELLMQVTKEPLLVAHSTGAMVAIELVKQTGRSFQKMALIAPLFQPYLWKLSKLGIFLTKPFLQTFTRIFKKNSSDERYLLFTEEDPLQEKQLPVSWLQSLNIWLRKRSIARKSNLSFLMIQGNRDKTVDMNYGMKQVRSFYPKSSIVLIDKGHHQLLNEGKVIREQTFSIILNYLKKEDNHEVRS